MVNNNIKYESTEIVLSMMAKNVNTNNTSSIIKEKGDRQHFVFAALVGFGPVNARLNNDNTDV